MEMTVVFLGAGNLATSLAPVLCSAGCRIVQVYSRTMASARQLAQIVGAEAVDELSLLNTEADVYIYALRDDVYSSLSIPAVSDKAVHLLTSGSIPYSAVSGQQHRGVLYPFQTFSKQKPVTDFAEVPVLVDGEDDYALGVARKLAQSISSKVYVADDECRARLHLAGVIANNFSNCMYALAQEQLQKAGLPFDILLPLIDETARKVHTMSPREAQTGPAARGDNKLMEQQIALLDDDNLRTIYRLVSDNILSTRK